MEELIRHLAAINPVWVYLSVSGFAFLENMFPPLPSDVLILFVGSLVGVGSVDFTVALIATTLGSTAGFVAMYKLGDWFGLRILETGKIPFIPVENVHKVERWFRKYGYFLIVVNRFLTGTRAVISFFAGMSELPLTATASLSFVSALVWNFLLLFAGKELGENWPLIGSYLAAYSKVLTFVLLLVVFLLIVWFLYKNMNRTNGAKKST
ncbi:MAG: DedA family protein [Ignavibacteriales bacterium]|nr:DedA family protein [Ignavibacteriales bacterium]